MASLLLLFVIICVPNACIGLITHSITPTEPSDAITIKLPNGNSKINSNTEPATWTLQNPSKPYSWGIHLQTLSKSLLFTSKHSCLLNITIDGIQKSKNGAIFYVFSIGSSFISFAHDFDGNLIINGKKGIFIYPECRSNLATISSKSKIGKLYNGVRGSKSLRQKLSQTMKDATSTKWRQISDNNNDDGDISIAFPIYFVIKNYYLKKKSIFTLYDSNNNVNIECEYNNAFPLNKPFNLFMSTDVTTSKQIFDIKQFIISRECNKQKCDYVTRGKHIEWTDRNDIQNDEIISHKHNIHINKNKLAMDVNVDLSHLGYSIYDNNKYSTKYALNFNRFNPIYENDKSTADLCSNYWNMNKNTNSKEKCGIISYHAYFTWDDLLFNCREYNNDYNSIKVINTQKWVNLTGAVYINIISDSNTYNLLSIPFNIPILKSFGIQSNLFSSTDINIFGITIAAVYKYKEREDVGYKLILLTESTDYIMLIDPILILYPFEHINNENIQYIKQPINGKHCINTNGPFCSQLWEIYIDNVACPPIDLSGVYGLQFDAICNPLAIDDNNNEQYCQEYKNKKITLTSHLTWIDSICEPRIWIIQFDGNLQFYKDITFHENINDNVNNVFTTGVDTVFVMLKIRIPSANYIISNIKLTNVWICSMDENKYGKLVVSQLRAIGGCLSPNIDKNGPYHIIQNYNQHFYFNAKHIHLNELNDDVTDEMTDIVYFSFNIPKTIKREKLFIHTQVTLSLMDKRLHANRNEYKQNQIRHFGAYINIKPQQIIINNLNIFAGYQMDKLVILLIVSLVLCVIGMNIFVVTNNAKQNNNSTHEQSELYDTETTVTINESMASHKRLYDLIQGLYTSHDESKDMHKKKKKNKKKKPKNNHRSVIIPKDKIDIQIKIEKKECNKNQNKKNEINEEEKELNENKNEKESESDNETEIESNDELTTEMETDTQNINNGLHDRFKPFRKNDTDFTTDIQTLDELTSCTEMNEYSDMEAKKNNNQKTVKRAERIKPKIKHNASKSILNNKTNNNNNNENVLISKTDEKIKPKIKLKPEIIKTTDEINDDMSNNNNNTNDAQYTYTSETEQEKRERVKLIKQMIEDTEIETEYTMEYSDDYEQYQQYENDD